jgi:hypothetical protein
MRLKYLARPTLAGQIMTLAVVLAALYSIAALDIWLRHPVEMYGIAGLFVGLCFIAALLSLLGESYFAQRRLAAVGMYWAMMIRTGVPLLAVMLMKIRGGPFVEPSAICYLIAFYFGALIVQVVLAYNSAETSPSTAEIQSK